MRADIHKLKIIMFSKGETNTSISKKLNINRDTFSRWLKYESIPLNKMHELIDILEMNDEMIMESFFVREEEAEKFIIWKNKTRIKTSSFRIRYAKRGGGKWE